MEKLKVGMIGVWNFGKYRRQKMKESGLFEVMALCDLNKVWLASASEDEGGVAVYADFEEMLKHPGLEGIVISTGANSHAALATMAMRSGKHVFIEKPLCCSAAEAESLRQAQRETGRVVGTGHNHCSSDPLLNLAKSYIEEGKLGAIVSFEENSSHSGGLEIKPGDWRGLAGRNPGGMLFQCGVHAIHALGYLFGPIDAVQAMMRYDANPATETADAANVLMHCKSGVIGTLNCYHVTGYCHEMRIFGTKGNLYLDTHKRRAWFQARKRNEEETREELTVPPLPQESLYGNLTAWYHGIRKGEPVYPGLEDGIAAILPVFAAERSAKTRTQDEIPLL